MTGLHDSTVAFQNTADSFGLVHSQWLPDDYISDLKKAKINSGPESHLGLHVAEIPVSVVDDLKRRLGFDVMKEPAAATLKKLRELGLDAFIQTNKSI